MYGAILGDIIGSPFEFDMGDKTKIFPLFSRSSHFTDDSVLTIAVAEAFMEFFSGNSLDPLDEAKISKALVRSFRKYCRLYPNAGYGGRFHIWLNTAEPKPYGSFGNGSAMRVSPVSWMFDNIGEVRKAARLSASVTHNHPEGIKGAEAVASAIFMARKASSKAEIKQYIEENFEYKLDRTIDEIRPKYHHVESCMESVPEAITAFLEGDSFEDVIRTTVSIGGDTDTLSAISGSIAEAFYGIPDILKQECERRLDPLLLSVARKFRGLFME